MSPFLLIFALAAFACVAVYKRDWALCLIILLLPTYQIRFLIGAVPMTFLESLILVLASVELLDLLYQRRLGAALEGLLSKHRAVLVFILVFLFAALVSVFTSPDIIKAAGIFKAFFLEAVLFYFLTILIIDDGEKMALVFKTLAILVLYLSAFGVYQFITLANLPFSWWAVNIASRRITSLVNHPNALALLLGPILAMLMMLPKKNKLVWFAIGFGLLAFYLTFSRAAWLALAVVILGLGLFTKAKKKILAAVSIGVLLILLVPFSRTKLLDLVKGRDLSQQNRYVLWSAAADMLKKSPLFGVGLTGFHEAYKNYPLGPDRVVQNYPHNLFLNFWLELGLLGLVSMVGLLILFYKKIYGAMTSPLSPPHEEGIKGGAWALAAAAGMSMILLHGLVDVPYFKNDLSMLFWLIYAFPFLTTHLNRD